MTVAALPAPAATHLAELDTALVGPRRAKGELLRELGDHLEDATEAYTVAGRSPEEAAELAARDFGSIDVVAPALQTTLAVAASRRTALVLFLVLIIQPFLWDSGLNLAAVPHASVPDGGLYPILDTVVELGGFAVIVGAVLVLVATGVGQRWFGVGRGVARVAGWFALASALFVPATAVSMAALTDKVGFLFWFEVVALMGAPLAAVGMSARRTLAACASI